MSVQNHNLKLFIDFCKNSVEANDVDPAISYMHYIVDRLEFNEEQVLWLCFTSYQQPT